MSRIFYDHLIVFEDLEFEIEQIVESKEEKEELWGLIDEIIHYEVLETILEVLPQNHHQEFLLRFFETPYSEDHIKYLNEKVGADIEEIIASKIKDLEKDILLEIKK